MKINKSYKIRIYPNKTQKDAFEKYFGVCRFVYNSVLAYKIDSYKHGIKYSAYDAIKDFTEIKKFEGYEWLNEINAQTIQQEILNLDNAFKNFFKTKNVGFPKFKSKKKDSNSFKIPNNNGTNKIDFQNRKIKIPKIDCIKFKDKRIFNSKIKSITVSKNRCNQYFASILVEEEFEINLPKKIEESKIFSADMSCKDFLVSSEMKFENQKFYRKNERTLKIRQRRLSRKQKGSHNRGKERLKVAKFHQKIVNKRRGHQLNLAHELSQKFEALIFEDLNIKGMQQFNKGVSKTVTLDFSFSEFLNNLEWKCFKENKHFVKIDRWFPSSKLCSSCGQVKKELLLSERNYICDCGLEIDRDLNASINIKKEGINLLKNSMVVITKSYACKDMSKDLNSSVQEAISLQTYSSSLNR
jgi:putative transposase